MLFKAYTSTKVLHTSYYIADGGNALTMGGCILAMSIRLHSKPFPMSMHKPFLIKLPLLVFHIFLAYSNIILQFSENNAALLISCQQFCMNYMPQEWSIHITWWILFEKELGKRIQNIIAKLEMQEVGQNYFKKYVKFSLIN